MSNILEKALIELGLHSFSIKVYQHLLKNSDFTIEKIAKSLGTYRLKIYQEFEVLENFGLLVRDPYTNKITSLEPPAKILSSLKQKELGIQSLVGNFAEILPSLQKDYYIKNNYQGAKVYRGKTEFLTLFHQILDESDRNTEILMLGEGADFDQVIPFEYYYKNWALPRIKKQVKVKVLWKQPMISGVKGLLKTDAIEYRQSKVLPKSFNMDGELWIAQNKVIMWNTRLVQAVVIEDQLIANFMKNWYELFWNLLGH